MRVTPPLSVLRPGLLSILALGVVLAAARAVTPFPVDDVNAFIDRHCSSCHNDVDREAGLDLTTLKFEPGDATNFLTWVHVHDRVQSGEMPPKDKRRPESSDLGSFVRKVATSLITAQQEQTRAEGRATRRRLNRYEYENVLRDLLSAPWLEVRDRLPEDGEAYGYNRIGDALDVSHVHMSRYLAAADYALRQVLHVHSDRPPTTVKRYYAREESSLAGFGRFVSSRNGPSPSYPERRHFPLLGTQAQPEVRAYRAPITVGESDPATRELEAVGWISSNYVIGYGSGWGNFTAPATGRYRLRFSGYTVWVAPGGYRIDYTGTTPDSPAGYPEPPRYYLPDYDNISTGRRPEPVHIYSGGSGISRRLGTFDLTPAPQTFELAPVWLLENENILTDAARFLRSRPSPTFKRGGYTNPLAQRDGMPAVAFRWMEVEGPLYDESSHAGYRLLFGDLPLKRITSQPAPPANAGRGRGGRGGRGAAPEISFEVTSANPRADAEKLLRAFIARAYRAPAPAADLETFLGTFEAHFGRLGFNFADSMLAAYTAILASPSFVYIDEKPGRLADQAVATRLAFLLWNSEPDARLRDLAARGELTKPAVLRAETTRLLEDPRSRRFVEAFLDYWIDLRKMEETTPDSALYPDYYLDDSLTEAAVDETRMFFTELLQRDLPARNIVDSSFTYLNERLASHYGIGSVPGVAMRRIDLPKDSVRGGFLTQASVLKVTANGTTTSPVLRGKWIMERIIGFEVPPPPAAVPAVEPDIRGAVTIRQQLDKHRADESCAMCHRKIDPPGLALESFDVLGAWRDRYRAVASDRFPAPGFGKSGWPFAFHYALPVEPEGELADGRTFRDVRELKQLLLADEPQIARNFARQLATYATGAPIRFADRPAIEQILDSAKDKEYGIRTILHGIIQSELFLNK